MRFFDAGAGPSFSAGVRKPYGPLCALLNNMNLKEETL